VKKENKDRKWIRNTSYAQLYEISYLYLQHPLSITDRVQYKGGVVNRLMRDEEINSQTPS